MATIYVQEGEGSGSGTLSDPYYWDDEYATAYAAAGVGGIIYLMDGTYQMGRGGSTGINFYNVDYGDVTNIALNKHKATINQNATIGYVRNARFKNCHFVGMGGDYQNYAFAYSATEGHYIELTGCTCVWESKSPYYIVQTAGYRFRGCTFWFKSIGGAFMSTNDAGSIIENCTFRINGDDPDLSGTYDELFKQLDNMFYNTSNEPIIRNNIFSFGYTANANLAAFGFIRSGYGGGTFQNNCFFQDSTSASLMPMSSLDNATVNSGNIDLDPQFLDSDSYNFSLRPTSPCLNAGYLD